MGGLVAGSLNIKSRRELLFRLKRDSSVNRTVAHGSYSNLYAVCTMVNALSPVRRRKRDANISSSDNKLPAVKYF
ncbi:hypothetical protein TNCV_2809161 [Trichonephila clavipes]|nr:hypothetical protein TNCV_2809161 [Trichonephila clavipes]